MRLKQDQKGNIPSWPRRNAEHAVARFGSEAQEQHIDPHTIQYEVQVTQSRAQRYQLPSWIFLDLGCDSQPQGCVFVVQNQPEREMPVSLSQDRHSDPPSSTSC